jgi:hypothetical protein
MIVGSPHKGLYANVKSVGATDITVEVTALLVGASSLTQTIKWHELMIVYIANYSPRQPTDQSLGRRS